MDNRERPQRPQLPPTSIGWRIWFAVCAVSGAVCLGVAMWLAIAAIHWLNRH